MTTLGLTLFLTFFITGGISGLSMMTILDNKGYSVSSMSLFSNVENMADLIKKTENKRTNKIYSILLGVSVVAPLFGMVAFVLGREDINVISCRFYSEFLGKEINGVVSNKYIDYNNHASETISLISYGRKVKGTEVGRYSIETYDYVQPGDTIIKQIGSPYIEIKNGSRTKQFKCNVRGCDDNGQPNTASAQNS